MPEMSAIGTGLAALNLAARFPRAAAVFTAIPKPVWEAIAVLGYLAALVATHQHFAHAAIDRAVTAAIIKRDGQWQQRLDQAHAAALTWKGQVETKATTIATLQRKLTDEENKRVAADADAARLRGPGKAAAPAGCRPGDRAGPAATADRPDGAAAAGANAGPQMPAADGSGQFALVPWDWLVDVVSEHDQLRNSVASVIAADAKQRAVLKDAKDKAAKAAAAAIPPPAIAPK
jgi:hypothetical protein